MSDFGSSFEASWKRFETTLSGKLLAQAKKQDFTIGLANIILKDASSGWFSMYDVTGKWLIDYSEENPEKGEIITDILKNDLSFTEQAKIKKLPSYAKFAIPVAVGILGGGVARFLTAKTITVAASVVIPAAATYPIVNNIEKNLAEDSTISLVTGYMNQLGKYKDSIMSVIEN